MDFATKIVLVLLFVGVAGLVFAFDLAWHRQRREDARRGKVKEWPAA